MRRIGILLQAAIAAAGLAASMTIVATPEPAAAVVYCKSYGVPKGCVVRPPPKPKVVVYCTAPGVPVGCVVRPAPRAVVYCTAPGVPVGCKPGPAGTPMNRGGPVNHIGRW
ncbi:MAG: hypothetical protein ACOYJQ_01900 [Pseudochelatococcus sp.]|uniref:hypothetical protein n=1 Tax=Pseudochelatococcus sp. TaxID=2020869 RepID=UPI003D8E49F6